MAQKKIAIYLAGSIAKGHESNSSFWTEGDMALLEKELNDFAISFLNPAFRTDDLSDQLSVFGRDMLQVFSSHVVFVDARGRRGLGVGAEMMWAKVNCIPVVTWAPKNTHYHQEKASVLGIAVDNYIHPFVESLSDKIVEDLVEGARWIRSAMSRDAAIKGVESISLAMEHYKESQLPRDQPMQELLTSCSELQLRALRAHPQVVFN